MVDWGTPCNDIGFVTVLGGQRGSENDEDDAKHCLYLQPLKTHKRTRNLQRVGFHLHITIFFFIKKFYVSNIYLL